MPLSSSLTFMIRTVLPVGWAILLPVVLLIRVPSDFEPMKWFMSAGLVILLIESAAWFVRLKDVYADADGLVISDRRARARVPWGQIAEIRKTWWGKAHFARLVFRTPTRFGRSVLFMMSFDPFSAWKNQASVRTIRDHMDAASRSMGTEPAPRS